MCARHPLRLWRSAEIGFSMIDRRLYVVVFVQRSAVMRIVSLRKANSREVKLYDETI